VGDHAPGVGNYQLGNNGTAGSRRTAWRLRT
jgi:hypothetical protein